MQRFSSIFSQLLGKCQSAVAGRGMRKKFRFKNKLVSLDASVIDLSLSNLAALLRHQLFVYCELFGWLNAPFEGPPQLADAAKAQLSLGIAS